MHYRQLGRSGLTVSVVGLGCNNFGWRMDLENSRAVVDTALEQGINLFDTADVYGRGQSETILGELLKGRRDEAVIATKWGSPMSDNPPRARASRHYIRQAVEASLRRLQTDYIDLYQLHRPDGVTPMAETLGALDELVKEGKVRYIGSSNLTGWQIADAEWLARTNHNERFISAQNHYSLLQRDAEKELLPAADTFGIGVLPFFPLANGLLTGKYGRDQERPTGTRMDGREITEATYDRIEALADFAKQRGHTLLELAISGLASRPPVSSVIAGATKAEQVIANAKSGDWQLSESELEELAKLP
ncbi:MAG: aldo/keto reductase [Acidimicrobiaceae bacterium]|nr:aldo/keto reductase [Acidimicrobiaceae bacterium]